MKPAGLLVAVLVAMSGCRASEGAKAEPMHAEAPGPRPPLIFDPANLREGLVVGALTVDSADVVWSEELREWVGSVRFAGDVRLTGSTVADSAKERSRGACFEADSASAAQLPRWPGDDRRPWFCFENADTARRMLGAPDSSRAATIVVNRFTTVRAHTDAANSAWLLAAE